MAENKKIIYYEDELNDEFSSDNIETKKIDGEYEYIREGKAARAAHIFWYRIIATPLAFLFMKLRFHHKIVNRDVLKHYNKRIDKQANDRQNGSKCNVGYYMYGNHTNAIADALIPTMVNFPRRVSVIVHPNNVSMPVLGKITPYLGALPLPGDLSATRNFINAVEKRGDFGDCIMIYPEAHIWPYYTDIRPFKDMSFRYPAKYDMPVFSLTNTYQKTWLPGGIRMVTYIDGPFYADKTLPLKEQKKQLRDTVYNTMKERSINNNLFLIEYVKKNESVPKEN